MNRRKFLTQTLTGVAGAGAVAACGGPREGTGPAVHTRRSVTWRLASSFPRGLDTIFGATEVLAERVEAMTEGQFRIRVYPMGEIVPGLAVMDAVQQGSVQVGQTASYYYIGKNPALAFDACVPFGLTSRQQTAWLTQGGGLDLMNELFADFNVLTFPAGNTGAQMGGWFKREIRGVADLQGLKMRIPGLGGEVMSRLGATVQVLAGGDIYPALERGAIDATEWVGPYDDEKLGFHKIARYYYYPGWWEPGPSLSYHVNRSAWDKLPAAFQEIFRSAASESATVMQARYDQRNPAALARLAREGIEIRPFPDELMLAAEKASFDMLEEQAAADPAYAKVYAAWKRARAESYRWFGTAELAYASFAFARA
ncbi:MAG TPA: TRAP transporter substrate-binding protein [Thermoanaerobaculia bacterium]|jgi:TRAP-type mannitol/chloroaromatic compound transport system substrate-binding protein